MKIRSGDSRVIATAKELGPPITPERVADLRKKFGDQVASPFAVLAAEWKNAVDARDPVRVLIAERVLSIGLTGLFTAIQQVEGDDHQSS